MNITPQVKEIIDYAQRKIKRVANQDVSLYPVPKDGVAWFTWDQLCATVCTVLRVDQKTVKSGWRKGDVVLARHLIWYYGVKYKFDSTKFLAQRLRAINHTSVVHANKKIKGLLECGDEIVFDAVKKIDLLLDVFKPEKPVEIPF